MKSFFVFLVVNAASITLFSASAWCLGGQPLPTCSWFGGGFVIFMLMLGLVMLIQVHHQKIDYYLWKVIEDEGPTFGWDHNNVCQFISSLREWVNLVVVLLLSTIFLILLILLVNAMIPSYLYWINKVALFGAGIIAIFVFFLSCKHKFSYDHRIQYEAEKIKEIEVV